MKIIKCIPLLLLAGLIGCQGSYFDANSHTAYEKNNAGGVYSYGFDDIKRPKVEEKPKHLYCYRSLGQVECFKKPQQGRDAQLVNYYTADNNYEPPCDEQGY